MWHAVYNTLIQGTINDKGYATTVSLTFWTLSTV
jgi:hypothetical protein